MKMDRELYSAVRHSELELVSPLPMSAYELALRDALERDHGDVVDVGCGKGALLIPFARRGWNAHGIDRSPYMAEAARQAAMRHGLSSALRVTQADARTITQSIARDTIDCALCIGASQALGGLYSTLAELQRIVRPGGRVVVGELYWRRPPEEGLLEALGMKATDLGELNATFTKGAPPGLEPLACIATTGREFAAYEEAQRVAGRAWCAANAEHPDAAAIAARGEEWWALYERYTRESFGFALCAYDKR